MRTTLPLLFLFAACGEFAPPVRESTTTGMTGITLAETTSGETGDWPLPDRGAPDVAPPPPTPGTTGGPTSGTATDETTAEDGPRVDLAALRIVEVLPDPIGKDGGAASPEFVEILNDGDAATALAGLEIVARAWPVLDAEELGIAGEWLEPGQRLVVLRHVTALDLPEPALVIGDAGISVAFVHADGLRNDDGGVLLRAGGVVGDLMIFGAAQPAPWDSQEAWSGPAAPAPGVGVALCRVGDVDSDAAGDFAACTPSPGGVEDGSGESTGTPTSDTGEDPFATTGVVDETTGTGESTGEPLPAEVVIVEVLSNPPGPGNGEKADEFVELLNLGPGTVDLADWTIADSLADDADGVDPLLYLGGDGGCMPATCLAPGGRAIVVGSAYTGPTGAGLVLVTDDTSLANAGLAVYEPVVVRDADGVTRSTYRAWEDPSVAPDPALAEEALVRDPAATDAPEAWSFAAPTPGD